MKAIIKLPRKEYEDKIEDIYTLTNTLEANVSELGDEVIIEFDPNASAKTYHKLDIGELLAQVVDVYDIEVDVHLDSLDDLVKGDYFDDFAFDGECDYLITARNVDDTFFDYLAPAIVKEVKRLGHDAEVYENMDSANTVCIKIVGE